MGAFLFWYPYGDEHDPFDKAEYLHYKRSRRAEIWSSSVDGNLQQL